MDGKLRNMTSLYLRQGNRLLLLYRIGSKVIPIPVRLEGISRKKNLTTQRLAFCGNYMKKQDLWSETSTNCLYGMLRFD